MSAITDFFAGTGTDHRGRTLSEILLWDDASLESVHDYIQWVFPNRAPSAFNPRAPLLTDEDVAAFVERPELRAALERALKRMWSFYKLDADAVPWWMKPGDHNMLRITRILLSLTELGLRNRAGETLDRLSSLAKREPGSVPPRAMGFWIRAVE